MTEPPWRATRLPRTLPRTIHLGGEVLGNHHHVCALVEGPDDAYELLLPFIVEGFEQGDRAFHVVEPGSREAHLERLAGSGIDVSAATASRQLEVRTWNEAYLRGGRFDRTAQLALLRDRFREGIELGYPRTRAIGTMEWALEAQAELDLPGYEERRNLLLRSLPDIAICVYDLRRHSARVIADVLGLHPVAFVGGTIRPSPRPAELPARDRVLAAASQLFQERGIQATGVDSIVGAAGVAKATFYRHFPSKDDLVVAWLRDPRSRWIDRIRTEIEASGADAAGRIPLFFQAVADWLEAGPYRGCPYLNTAVEIVDPTHPARLIIHGFLQEVEDYLDGLLAAAGYRQSRTLAATLQTLLAGAITLAVARRDRAPVATARDAALMLLAQAERD